MGTAIEWTDERWNPVTGCSKISDGCRNCYAEVMDRRFASTRGEAFRPWTSPNAEHNVRLQSDRLKQPLHWRKPRRVFVNSMSDLFHDKVPNEFIAAVFGIMASSSQHTFQILTKRPEHMLKWFEWLECAAERVASVFPDDDLEWRRRHVLRAAAIRYIGTGVIAEIPDAAPWPLENVWVGVSVENQQSANERIPLLFETPAAIRFLSCEPLLEGVNLESFLHIHTRACYDDPGASEGVPYLICGRNNRIDWVIVGGESGTGARPMHPHWVMNVRDQCVKSGVPFFFKQWGVWAPYVDDTKFTHGEEETERNAQTFINLDGSTGTAWIYDDDGTYANWAGTLTPMSCVINRFGKKRSGRELNGRTWDEMPRCSL